MKKTRWRGFFLVIEEVLFIHFVHLRVPSRPVDLIHWHPMFCGTSGGSMGRYELQSTRIYSSHWNQVPISIYTVHGLLYD